MIEALNAQLAEMTGAAGSITQAVGTITCQDVSPDTQKILDEVGSVNSTVANLASVFGDILKPVEDAEDTVRTQGRKWVSIAVPTVLAGPFGIYVLLAGWGAARRSTFGLNAGAVWAGLLGLPAALCILCVFFVVSVVLADFCYFGPEALLTENNEDNRYLAYYLSCEGTNPLETDVDSVDNALGTLTKSLDDVFASGLCGPDGALTTIDAAVQTLSTSLTTITNEILSCAYISPAVSDLIFDALCDRTVSGLYQTWVVLATAGVSCYVALLATPFAIAPGAGDDADGGVEMKAGPKAGDQGHSAQTFLAPGDPVHGVAVVDEADIKLAAY